MALASCPMTATQTLGKRRGMRLGITRGVYVLAAKPMGVVGAILQSRNCICNNLLCVPRLKTFRPVHNHYLVLLILAPTHVTFLVTPLVAPLLTRNGARR